MTELSAVEFGNGIPPLYFRKGTSDERIIADNCYQRCDYEFPRFEPSVIFDIGANIGVIAVLMANVYPMATIYCYEPQPENFDILRTNTCKYGNIRVKNAALGAETGRRDLYFSNDPANHGGCSLFRIGVDLEKQPVRVDCLSVRREIELAGGRVDLIKIDTEGAEWEVLSSIPREQLLGCTGIVGELHGLHDYQVLEMLDGDFQLQFSKTFQYRQFPFSALRKPAG